MANCIVVVQIHTFPYGVFIKLPAYYGVSRCLQHNGCTYGVQSRGTINAFVSGLGLRVLGATCMHIDGRRIFSEAIKLVKNNLIGPT
ncbi:hypothetical protein CGCF415_v004514 [Colletotrichum fructicola]|uniref:Uncharacterized protein n=1 Tax=Colletotrichum fructicola (strain Nara gc5) TaxID=1213859 RepID=A0A7J6IVR3_COLFN|nr:hypothetical protein CGGC5_v011031 [Colletotrichum fructicola Nara gc5]KAF4882260.1 hypothetical protein CGCFRS4_v014737 [Colletotrichum fructicola]KAF4911556.1 hypothetical protein CGCF415_v004514 [Colletotrichum fructicola]KAF4939274.1 hypothetical protein CGCF245_v003909 [Colletotrichum fructicola]